MQRLKKSLAQKAAPKRPEWPSYGNWKKRHPKPAFFEKVQRGYRKKFFRNRPKSSPHLRGPTALWPKWHYPLISMQFKWKDWTKFWRKKQLQKFPNGQGMAIFARSPKTRIFWKSLKGGRRDIFQKSPGNKPSFEWPKSPLGQMALSSN